VKIINKINHRNNWLKKPIFSHQYQHWLTDNGSLTARLQQRYTDFSVKKVSLKYAKPLHDEAALLRHPMYKHALIRDVMLMGNYESVVFAHSVLPHAALRGAWNKLGRLGNKPLGATLFANPKVKRTPLAFKKLSRIHPLYQCASKHLPQAPTFLWARRSIFSLHTSHKKYANILVTEIFLPPILQLNCLNK